MYTEFSISASLTIYDIYVFQTLELQLQMTRLRASPIDC